MNQNEAAARVYIDTQLKQQGWDTHNPNSVRYEVFLGDGTRADYVLCDRHGRSMAVIEAKCFSINPTDAAEQARNYARQLQVPYIFLANGNEVCFWEWENEAYARPVKTLFKQDDLERRFATRQVKRDVMALPIDMRVVLLSPAHQPVRLRGVALRCSFSARLPRFPSAPRGSLNSF